MRQGQGRRLDLGRLCSRPREAAQGRLPGRHADGPDRGHRRHGRRVCSTSFGAVLVDAKDNITVKSDADRQALEYLQEADGSEPAGRARLGRRRQQQVADLRQGRADHEPAERLGGRQARRAEGRRAVLDARHAGGSERPLRAASALLRPLELLQEQVGGQEPAAAPLAAGGGREAGGGQRRLRPAVVRELYDSQDLGRGRAAEGHALPLPEPAQSADLSMCGAPAPPKIAAADLHPGDPDQDGRAQVHAGREQLDKTSRLGREASSKATCAPEPIAARRTIGMPAPIGAACSAARDAVHSERRRWPIPSMRGCPRSVDTTRAQRRAQARLAPLHAAQVDHRLPDERCR